MGVSGSLERHLSEHGRRYKNWVLGSGSRVRVWNCMQAWK